MRKGPIEITPNQQQQLLTGSGNKWPLRPQYRRRWVNSMDFTHIHIRHHMLEPLFLLSYFCCLTDVWVIQNSIIHRVCMDDAIMSLIHLATECQKVMMDIPTKWVWSYNIKIVVHGHTVSILVLVLVPNCIDAHHVLVTIAKYSDEHKPALTPVSLKCLNLLVFFWAVVL